MTKAAKRRGMRILLTNDDGIHAPGLAALERIAAQLSDDVWVVAPEAEQSGAAHSLTLHTPVRVRSVGPRRYAVLGTPTDCVLLALKAVLPKKPAVTLVLSGVNRGSNVGDDVTYSGTVAGAMEGTMLGVPSVALSLLCGDEGTAHWETAEQHAPSLLRGMLAHPWPRDTLMNINFPDCAPKQVRGVRACAQGKRRMNVRLSERVDPKGRPYYWLGGLRDNTPEQRDVDLDLLERGYITITPIGMDLTDYRTLASIDDWY